MISMHKHNSLDTLIFTNLSIGLETSSHWVCCAKAVFQADRARTLNTYFGQRRKKHSEKPEPPQNPLSFPFRSLDTHLPVLVEIIVAMETNCYEDETITTRNKVIALAKCQVVSEVGEAVGTIAGGTRAILGTSELFGVAKVDGGRTE